jgi:hypothetical protein
VSEWQPIETAPRDSTVVLVYRADAGVFTAWFTNPGFALGLPDDEWTEDEWWSTDGTDLQGDLMPTHWMPLPAPPNPET